PRRLPQPGQPLRRPVQLLLPEPWPTLPAPAARAAVAADRGRGAQLAPGGQPGAGGAARSAAGGHARHPVPTPGAGPAPRAAAPGAAAHGPALQLFPQPPGAGLPGRPAGAAHPHPRAAALAPPPRRAGRDRPRRRELRLRLRAPAPPGLAGTLPPGQPPGQQRRLPVLPAGWRLQPQRAVALRRLGDPARTGLAGPAVLAPRRGTRLAGIHPRRPAAAVPGRAGLPPEFL